MRYTEMNKYAWSGTPENLIKLLKSFGNDNEAFKHIQMGVDGKYLPETARLAGFPMDYASTAVDQAAKKEILLDFQTKTGVFSPNATEASFAEKFNAAQARVIELEKHKVALEQTISTQQAVIESLKKASNGNNVGWNGGWSH